MSAAAAAMTGAVAPALAAPAAVRPPINKWLTTISITFGTLMGTIDSSIVNVAVPHLRGALGATVQEITWVTTGFAIASVIVMPLTAFLGRFFGQKRVYMAALMLFVAGSLLCALARSLPAMVIARVVQGLGAGALQPTEQAILRQTFPPEEQGMAMALFGIAVVLGPAFGPTLGGYIVDNYSWPWIFFINLPVGALALFMVSRFVYEAEDIRRANQEQAEKQRGHIDWLGIALLSVCLVTLQYVLEEGSSKDWFDSSVIRVCCCVSFVTLLAFIWRELTAIAPVVDLSLFKDEVFLSGTLIGAVMFAMLMSLTFLLPLFMQEMLGFTATQAGIALMPRSLIMMVCMPVVGRLYNKISPRLFIAFGICLFVYSAYLMSHYTLATTSGAVVGVLLMQGVAFSCLFIPLTTIALSQVPRRKMSDATGLNSLIRQIGGSAGLAIFVSLISRYSAGARHGLVAHLDPGRYEVMNRLALMSRMFVARGMDPSAAKTASQQALNGIIMQQSMVLTFEKLFMLAGVLFLLVMPLLLFLKAPAKKQNSEAAHVHIEV